MSLKRSALSFRYALKGLADLFGTQPNARIHLVAATVAAGAGWWFRISAGEWLAVVLSITLVIALEAVNTAFEHLTDLVSPEYHPLAGRTKDVAAAAVLLAALGAVVVGGIIFLPKIVAWLLR